MANFACCTFCMILVCDGLYIFNWYTARKSNRFVSVLCTKSSLTRRICRTVNPPCCVCVFRIFPKQFSPVRTDNYIASAHLSTYLLHSRRTKLQGRVAKFNEEQPKDSTRSGTYYKKHIPRRAGRVHNRLQHKAELIVSCFEWNIPCEGLWITNQPVHTHIFGQLWTIMIVVHVNWADKHIRSIYLLCVIPVRSIQDIYLHTLCECITLTTPQVTPRQNVKKNNFETLSSSCLSE